MSNVASGRLAAFLWNSLNTCCRPIEESTSIFWWARAVPPDFGSHTETTLTDKEHPGLALSVRSLLLLLILPTMPHEYRIRFAAAPVQLETAGQLQGTVMRVRDQLGVCTWMR